MSEVQPTEPWEGAAEDARLQALYNLLRDARLNEMYYYTRYSRFRRQELLIDIYLSIASCALGVFAAAFRDYGNSSYIIVLMSAQITLLAVVRPVLGLADKQARAVSRSAVYQRLRVELQDIAVDVRVNGGFSREHTRRFDRARQEFIHISVQDDIAPSRNLVRQLQHQVNEEYPPESFWWPNAEEQPKPTADPAAQSTAKGNVTPQR